MSEIIKYLREVVHGENLSIEDSKRAFQIILSGGATPPQLAAFLTALKMKGETVDEITGAALVMRSKVDKINATLETIDTCGTGGDALGTLNISTAVAFVVAGLGVPVAKHGNRAISSKCGSADVLEALGVMVEAPLELVDRSLEEAGICFLLATAYHKVMRHVTPTRKELGMRTIFNLLGPLTNPAGTSLQLIGVYEKDRVPVIAEVLRNLGSKKAWVMHGEDGLDELSISGPSYVAELKDGRISTFIIKPEDVGLQTSGISAIRGDDAAYNAKELRSLLGGKPGAYRDIVLLNSAAALIIGDKVDNLAGGVKLAAESIDSGKALAALHKLVEITNSGELADNDE